MRNNYDIIQDHYAASARGDIAAMFAHVSETVEWTEMAGFPCAGTWIGPQVVIDNVFNVLGSDWENYRFLPNYSPSPVVLSICGLHL